MPGRYTPNENMWVRVIEDFAPDHETVLIGHSLGGAAILEYLEKSQRKVGDVILVGTPVRYSEKLDLAEPYTFRLYAQSVAIEKLLDSTGFEEIYDWEKVRRAAKGFHLIYKNEDYRVPLDDGIVLAARLEADLQILPGTDHCDLLEMTTLNGCLLTSRMKGLVDDN